MADRRFEIDEILVRPGAYFNPQTEVLVVVDDSTSLDQEIFNLEEFERADWVLVSDAPPIAEPRRDELIETFQSNYHGGDGRRVTEPSVEHPDDDVEELEPDPDPDEE